MALHNLFIIIIIITVAYSSRQMGQTDGHTRKRKNHILQMVCRVEPLAA